MVLAGIALVLAGVGTNMGAIAIVCGVLLIWSGVVKIIVLRIWRATLPNHDSPNSAGLNDGTNSVLEYR